MKVKAATNPRSGEACEFQSGRVMLQVVRRHHEETGPPNHGLLLLELRLNERCQRDSGHTARAVLPF